MKQTEIEIKLDARGVDQVSELVQERMKIRKVQDRGILRTRLLIESILLDLSNHYNGEKKVKIIMRQRLGIKSITICYDGEEFNPLQSENGTDETAEKFISDLAMKPTWKYKEGVNEIYVKIPGNSVRNEIKFLIAVLFAVILGIVGSQLPAGVIDTTVEYVLDPVSSLFMKVLKSLSGLLIFFSIITGVCGIGSLSEFSKIGRYLIGRYVLFTFLCTGFCIMAVLPLHNLAFGSGQGEIHGKELYQMILDIVPGDPITPFLECNLLQIQFLAILISIAILALLRESSELHAVFVQVKNVLMYVISLLCRFLPIYIAASLTTLFWTNGMGVIRQIWKPLLFVVIFLHLMMIIKVLAVSIRCKVSPILLLKKSAETYLIGLSTSSTMAALGTALDANERRFGVPKNLSDFGVPVGNTIARHMAGGGTAILMIFMAEYSGVNISVGWLVSLWIYVSIMSFAMPPIAGGVLVCFGLMMAQFGIPSENIGLVAPLTLFSDFVMTCTYLVDEHMEMVLQARHWGTLNEKILRDSSK